MNIIVTIVFSLKKRKKHMNIAVKNQAVFSRLTFNVLKMFLHIFNFIYSLNNRKKIIRKHSNELKSYR